MPNNRLDFESIDQVEVFKENGDVIGTVKVSGVRSIEAAIEKALQQLPEATDPEAYVFELPPKKATLKEVAFCVKSIQLKRNNWSVLFLENSKVIEK